MPYATLPVVEGESIQDAIDSVTDAGPAKRYMIRVGAGTFDEIVTLQSYVSLCGSGADTIITKTGEDEYDPIITLAHGTSMSNLTISTIGLCCKIPTANSRCVIHHAWLNGEGDILLLSAEDGYCAIYSCVTTTKLDGIMNTSIRGGLFIKDTTIEATSFKQGIGGLIYGSYAGSLSDPADYPYVIAENVTVTAIDPDTIQSCNLIRGAAATLTLRNCNVLGETSSVAGGGLNGVSVDGDSKAYIYGGTYSVTNHLGSGIDLYNATGGYLGVDSEVEYTTSSGVISAL